MCCSTRYIAEKREENAEKKRKEKHDLVVLPLLACFVPRIRLAPALLVSEVCRIFTSFKSNFQFLLLFVWGFLLL